MSIFEGLTKIGTRTPPPLPGRVGVGALSGEATRTNYPQGLTDVELADAYGLADARYKDLGDERTALKVEILRRKRSEIYGETWHVDIKESKTVNFDREALRAALGELTPFMKVGVSVTLTARRLRRSE